MHDLALPPRVILVELGELSEDCAAFASKRCGRVRPAPPNCPKRSMKSRRATTESVGKFLGNRSMKGLPFVPISLARGSHGMQIEIRERRRGQRPERFFHVEWLC